MLLSSLWIAPIGMYYSGGRQKIMFGTGSCKVFAVDPVATQIFYSHQTIPWLEVVMMIVYQHLLY
jgi:hypothetical protein